MLKQFSGRADSESVSSALSKQIATRFTWQRAINLSYPVVGLHNQKNLSLILMNLVPIVCWLCLFKSEGTKKVVSYYYITGLYASFLKGQGHLGIFSLVKGTLWRICKFLLGHFKVTKQWPGGMEAITFVASSKYQACKIFYTFNLEKQIFPMLCNP